MTASPPTTRRARGLLFATVLVVVFAAGAVPANARLSTAAITATARDFTLTSGGMVLTGDSTATCTIDAGGMALTCRTVSFSNTRVRWDIGLYPVTCTTGLDLSLESTSSVTTPGSESASGDLTIGGNVTCADNLLWAITINGIQSARGCMTYTQATATLRLNCSGIVGPWLTRGASRTAVLRIDYTMTPRLLVS
jgi:hypothetical protein